MMKIGRRGSMTGQPDGARRAGPCRLSASALDNAIHRLSRMIEALVREPIDRAARISSRRRCSSPRSMSATRPTNIAPGVARRVSTPASTISGPRRPAGASAGAASSAPMRRRRQRHDRVHCRCRGESFYTPPGTAERPRGGRDPRGRRASRPSCRPPAAPRMPASSAATVRCWNSVWWARACTRSTRGARSPTSRRWPASTKTVLDRYFAAECQCRVSSVERRGNRRGVQGAVAFLRRDPAAPPTSTTPAESCLRSFKVDDLVRRRSMP